MRAALRIGIWINLVGMLFALVSNHSYYGWYYGSTFATTRSMTSFLMKTSLLSTVNSIQTATATSTRSMHVVHRAAAWRMLVLLAV
jgi:hypothetical protein